jgi:hypothetical protein
MLCPDYVTSCREAECRGTRRYALFFLGDDMCKHLQEKYGTKSASLLEHIEFDHEDDCGDVCEYVGFGYPAEEVRRVVLAVEREGVE